MKGSVLSQITTLTLSTQTHTFPLAQHDVNLIFARLMRVILSIKADFFMRERTTFSSTIIHANKLSFTVIRVKIKNLQLFKGLSVSFSSFLCLSLSSS